MVLIISSVLTWKKNGALKQKIIILFQLKWAKVPIDTGLYLLKENNSTVVFQPDTGMKKIIYASSLIHLHQELILDRHWYLCLWLVNYVDSVSK